MYRPLDWEGLKVDIREARSGAKALYHQVASLSGLDVEAGSAYGIEVLVEHGFDKVEDHRRPEAVANLLRVIAFALESVDMRYEPVLHEGNERAGENAVCPVYPFD